MPKKNRKNEKNVPALLGAAGYSMLGSSGDIWAKSDGSVTSVLQRVEPGKWRCISMADGSTSTFDNLPDDAIVDLYCTGDAANKHSTLDNEAIMSSLMDAVFSDDDDDDDDDDDYDGYDEDDDDDDCLPSDVATARIRKDEYGDYEVEFSENGDSENEYGDGGLTHRLMSTDVDCTITGMLQAAELLRGCKNAPKPRRKQPMYEYDSDDGAVYRFSEQDLAKLLGIVAENCMWLDSCKVERGTASRDSNGCGCGRCRR